MADAPSKKKGGGSFLTAKHAGLPTWGWGLVVVGGYFAYRLYKNYTAASAANALTGAPATGGVGGESSTTGGGTGTALTPGTIAEWIQSFLGSAVNSKYSAEQAYNDATAWTNGGCVSQYGATAIAQAIATLGLPAGFNPGPITVCATAKQPPQQSSKQQALHAAYDQAIADYETAKAAHASAAELQYLQSDVFGTQAAYSGYAGSAAARAAYEQAEAAYQNAERAHAAPSVIAGLFERALYAAAEYSGHGYAYP